MNYENRDLQKLRELGYDDIANEIVKGLKTWDDHLARSRASITEDYLRGSIGIHAHVSVRVNGTPGPSSQYCIQFQNDLGQTNHFVNDGNVCREMKSNAFFPVPSGFSRANGKRAVLVDSIQFVNLPEWVGCELVSSVVRLERVNDCTRGRSDTTDLLRFNVCIGRLDLKDRKLGTEGFFRSQVGLVSESESHSQVIECGTHVENAIANDCTPHAGNLVDLVNSESPSLMAIGERVRKWFRVSLVDDTAGFALDPRSNLLIEALDMFACPI